MIKKLLFVLAGLSVVLLTACNTMRGHGQGHPEGRREHRRRGQEEVRH
ncbi:hypothetical protein [Ideonella benzenivorans]